MRIKHWSGYGSVRANKVKGECSKNKLVVKVVGYHERGIDIGNDLYVVYNWLVKKFDKSVKDCADIESVDFTYGDDEIVDGISNETGVYTIHLKEQY